MKAPNHRASLDVVTGAVRTGGRSQVIGSRKDRPPGSDATVGAGLDTALRDTSGFHADGPGAGPARSALIGSPSFSISAAIGS
jgi:hypothetical protein